MDHITTISADSQACAGVRFTFRVMGETVRRALRRQLAPTFAKIADIEAERDEFYARLAESHGKPIAEIKVAELTPKERREFEAFTDAIDAENDIEVNPAYFRAGFVSVEGLAIDGKDCAGIPADKMLELAPPALVREIISAILRDSALSDKEKANLDSPSTSAAQVAGETSGTTAPPASAPDGTSNASAAGWALKD